MGKLTSTYMGEEQEYSDSPQEPTALSCRHEPTRCCCSLFPCQSKALEEHSMIWLIHVSHGSNKSAFSRMVRAGGIKGRCVEDTRELCSKSRQV